MRGLEMVASDTSPSLDQLLEGHASDVPEYVSVKGVVTDSRQASPVTSSSPQGFAWTAGSSSQMRLSKVQPRL